MLTCGSLPSPAMQVSPNVFARKVSSAVDELLMGGAIDGDVGRISSVPGTIRPRLWSRTAAALERAATTSRSVTLADSGV